ncbi:MAG: DUF1254 domain-containing protein [Woeseiaceae bacterium]
MGFAARLSTFLLGAGLCTIAALTQAKASEPVQDEAAAYAIGVQVYIHGFPMMDLYRTMWETSFDSDRGHDRTLNEFYFFRQLVTHKDDWVVTPNEDTIYHRAFLDLRKEPIILVIPDMGDRPYWFPLGDMYHDFDGHLSWDTVGRSGGNYALCPPGWQGVLPDDVQRVDVSTPIMWVLGRYAVDGSDDVPGATAKQDLTKLIPLSKWGQAGTTRPDIDPTDYPVFTRNDMTDARKFFTTLNAVLRMTPRQGHPSDIAIGGWLREINMDPAQDFEWDALSPQTQRGLERAVADAHGIIFERQRRAVPIVNTWQVARLPQDGSSEPLSAAGTAMLGLLYNPKEVATYDVTFYESNGEQLEGRNRYVLRFDPQPPVNAFWSLSMYSAETFRFVESAINRYSLGDRTEGIIYNDDGSLDVYIQHEEPTDPKERANWLPAPNGPFYMVTRHYSPQAPILNGDWVPTAVEKR